MVECGTVKHTKYKVRVIGMLVGCDLFRIQQLLWMIMHSCYIQWILSMQWFPFFFISFFLGMRVSVTCYWSNIEVFFISGPCRTRKLTSTWQLLQKRIEDPSAYCTVNFLYFIVQTQRPWMWEPSKYPWWYHHGPQKSSVTPLTDLKFNIDGRVKLLAFFSELWTPRVWMSVPCIQTTVHIVGIYAKEKNVWEVTSKLMVELSDSASPPPTHHLVVFEFVYHHSKIMRGMSPLCEDSFHN